MTNTSCAQTPSRRLTSFFKFLLDHLFTVTLRAHHPLLGASTWTSRHLGSGLKWKWGFHFTSPTSSACVQPIDRLISIVYFTTLTYYFRYPISSYSVSIVSPLSNLITFKITIKFTSIHSYYCPGHLRRRKHPNTTMPFKWTPEAEREMLFQIIKSLDIKPPQSVFADVAAAISDGVNANACSFVFSILPAL